MKVFNDFVKQPDFLQWNQDSEGYVNKGLMLDPKNSIGWSAKGVIDKDKGDTRQQSLIIIKQ